MTGNDDAAWWKDLAVRNLDRPALKMAGPRASETDVAAARVQAARQRPDLVRIAETGTPYCDRQSAGAELARRAAAKVAVGDARTLSAALRLVMREDPMLASDYNA